jgi:hypothetical protein
MHTFLSSPGESPLKGTGFSPYKNAFQQNRL